MIKINQAGADHLIRIPGQGYITPVAVMYISEVSSFVEPDDSGEHDDEGKPTQIVTKFDFEIVLNSGKTIVYSNEDKEDVTLTHEKAITLLDQYFDPIPDNVK